MRGRHVRLDRNTILGLAAILLWSATVALARSIAEQVGPLTAGAAVYLAAGLILCGHLAVRERSFRRLRELPRLHLFGCGALFLIYTLALFLALGLATDRYQTIEVGLLNYLWPAFTLFFSLPILGKRAGMGLVPATLLALFGIFLVLTPGTSVSWRSFLVNLLSNPVAYGLGVVAAISWALYSNLTRRWGGNRGAGAVPLFTLGTGVAFSAIRLFRPEPGTWSARVAAEVVLLALGTALAYMFWDLAMRQGDMVLVAACSYLTPFLSTLVSCLYLGVLPGAGVWLGCTLIVVGSFWSWRSIARRSTGMPG